MEAITHSRSTIWSTGLAMFSMFFGAGNIVYPLALGQFAQDQNWPAILGLCITAVFVPLMGLISMLLFEGDYISYFKRIGKLPGFLVAVMILAVIGPLAGIPRCITISYSTLSAFEAANLPGVNLISFSLVTCILIFFFTYRPRKVLKLLGYFLTPILLLSLFLIVFKGLITMPEAGHSYASSTSTFARGFVDGYNTMDLLAAFFFSSIVLLCLRKSNPQISQDRKKLFSIALTASALAAILLMTVYICFSFLAAGYSQDLQSVPSHQLLGTLAFKVLGPNAGLVAGVAVTFACFTTEIALTVVFSEFLHETLFKKKIPYPATVLITLATAFLVSTFQFEGITSFITPVLRLCYPALIVLAILNILHKLKGYERVKRIFYGTVLVTAILCWVF